MTIRKGVSLYSLQDAYGRGGLGLEGCIDAVEKMGTQGIEILSDQMIRGAANAGEETLAEFDAIMERHPLERVSNDIFINSSLYRNRWLTAEEQVELLTRTCVSRTVWASRWCAWSRAPIRPLSAPCCPWPSGSGSPWPSRSTPA